MAKQLILMAVLFGLACLVPIGGASPGDDGSVEPIHDAGLQTQAGLAVDFAAPALPDAGAADEVTRSTEGSELPDAPVLVSVDLQVELDSAALAQEVVSKVRQHAPVRAAASDHRLLDRQVHASFEASAEVTDVSDVQIVAATESAAVHVSASSDSGLVIRPVPPMLRPNSWQPTGAGEAPEPQGPIYVMYEAPPVEQATVMPAGEVAAPAPSAVAAATAFVLAGALAPAAFVLALPGWRNALWRALRASPAALLFSRIQKDRALEHPRRAEILEYVRQNPGGRLEAARTALGLANGTIRHHLGILEDQGLVRRVVEGNVARLFLGGPKPDCLPYVSSHARVLLARLRREPGLAQKELGRRLGMSQRMVSYHVRRLSERGLVVVQRDGMYNRCFPAPCHTPAHP